MQRGQEEDQGERVRRDDEQRQRAQAEQCGGVAGELVCIRHGVARQQPLTGDEPAGEAEHGEHDQPLRGPVGRGGAARRERARCSVGPRAEKCEELEEPDHPDPEEQPAAVAAQRRRQRNSPAAAAREQVDGRGEERKQAGDQHELDRPAADQARAEVEVARGSLRELEPLVERAEQILGRAPDLAEALRAEALARVPDRIGRRVARGRQRDRADSLREERRLLVEREREAEVDELLAAGRAASARAPSGRRRGRRRSRPAFRTECAACRRRAGCAPRPYRRRSRG